jgi:hypothetical protein
MVVGIAMMEREEEDEAEEEEKLQTGIGGDRLTSPWRKPEGVMAAAPTWLLMVVAWWGIGSEGTVIRVDIFPEKKNTSRERKERHQTRDME